MLRLSGLIAILSLIFLSGLSTAGAQTGAIFSADSQIIFLQDCQGGAMVCLEEIPVSDWPDYAFTMDGIQYNGPFATCRQDTLSIYSYEFLFGKGNSGPYRLDAWVVNGTSFSGVFQTMSDLVDSMNLWDPAGSWVLQPALFQIHGGHPGSKYSQMSLTVLAINSPAVIGYNQSFIPLARGLEVEKGIHQLIAINSSAGLVDTLTIVAGCEQVWSQVIKTEVGMTGSTCVDLSTLTGVPGMAVSLCPGPFLASQAILDPALSCISWTGLSVGTDTVCLSTCDEYGFCVDATLVIQVLYPGALDAIDLTVREGGVASICPPTISLPGNPLSLTNLCPEGSGEHAQLNITAGALCADLEGLTRGGPEYACLEICTDQGVCDTLTYAIQVTFQDTMELHLDVLIQMEETYCPDLSTLPGDTIQLTNLCPSGSGVHIEASIDPLTKCVNVKGILPGEDSLCLLLQDEFGNEILTFLTIRVHPPAASVHQVDLVVGESIEFCPDLSELAGDLNSVINDCDGSASGLLEVILDTGTGCVQMTGLTTGVGEVCLILCDEWGTCDSFFLQIHVLDSMASVPTVAVDDQGIMVRNQIINLRVLENDQWSGTDVSVTILPGSGPILGSAIVEIDNSITYRPDLDVCGLDAFGYILCTSEGCDTAVVTIDIECEDVIVLRANTGFSPNGDGINDYFTFEGLENYPKNTLEVYNRWGNRILKRENYQGNWDGTWGSLVVPDGTYFFILAPEGHPSLSGYVHIHR